MIWPEESSFIQNLNNTFLKNLTLALFVLLIAGACNTSIGTFEKNVQIPGDEWKSSFKPQVVVNITDTISRYNMYVVVRHKNAYQFNNLWVNIETKLPVSGKTNKQRFDLRLATDDRGWLGSGMDDIFEHRILITAVRFPNTGEYTFTFENIMRQDPLKHVMNIGLRLEKTP